MPAWVSDSLWLRRSELDGLRTRRSLRTSAETVSEAVGAVTPWWCASAETVQPAPSARAR